MRFIHPLIGCALILGWSCSSEPNKKEAQNADPEITEISEEEKQQLEEEYQQIPGAAIVRVPVDENGNVTGEPEMRVYKGDQTIDSGESVKNAFDESQSPEKMVASADELDGDTSTQSWHRWRGCGYGRIIWTGCYFHRYWYRSYKPYMYWRGRKWGYGHHRPYHHHGPRYRYYSYSPYRYW